MTARDLYAMCTGCFGGLVIQFVAHYLLGPTIWMALGLMLMLCGFIVATALHVTAIVNQEKSHVRDAGHAARKSAAPQSTPRLQDDPGTA